MGSPLLSRRGTLRRIPLSGLACLALLGATVGQAPLAGAAATPSAGQREPVPAVQPSVTAAEAEQPVPDEEEIEVSVFLAGRDTAGLEALLREITDPRNRRYRQYLSPEQFRARYSPPASAVAELRALADANGLRVVDVPANRNYVTLRGPVSGFEKAFGTSVRSYRHGGTTVRAASPAPTLPAALAGQVVAVTGLGSAGMARPHHVDGPRPDRGPHRRRPVDHGGRAGTAPPPNAFRNAPPCSRWFGERTATGVPPAYGRQQPEVVCGYVPDQLQQAYGVARAIDGGVDGRGVRVAVIDAYASPTIVADAAQYARRHGQRPLTDRQFRQVLPSSYRAGYSDVDEEGNADPCREQTWYGEETLDIEAVHALAPGADITYVAARSCLNQDLTVTVNQVVDRQLADLVSNSWGGRDEDYGSAELAEANQQIFRQAAATGIGIYFSSGDSGDGAADNDGTPSVQNPANSPWVTAVGGTALAIGRDGRRLWESGWSVAKSPLVDGVWNPAPPGPLQAGSGGGTSRVFAEPWYQRGVVPAQLARRWAEQPGRVVPDVAAVGDTNTGFLIGETQTQADGSASYSEYRIGGTSLAAPVFAGLMALADQRAGYHHGFANPLLYSLAGSPALYDPVHRAGQGQVRRDYSGDPDLPSDPSTPVVTSLRTVDSTEGTILRTAPGYDDVTGVGSVDGPQFLAALARRR